MFFLKCGKRLQITCFTNVLQDEKYFNLINERGFAFRVCRKSHKYYSFYRKSHTLKLINTELDFWLVSIILTGKNEVKQIFTIWSSNSRGPQTFYFSDVDGHIFNLCFCKLVLKTEEEEEEQMQFYMYLYMNLI